MAFGLPVSGFRKASQFSGGNDPLKALLSLIANQQGGYDEARQANESRYQDILELLGNTRGRTLDNLEQFGTSLINDANKNYDDQRNNLITDLADRGLSGSTKRIAVENSTRRERDAAVNRIKDTLLQNRAAADERFTDKAAGVMERREDPYPQGGGDLTALISQLTGLIGSGGNFGGAGGRGGYRSLPGTMQPGRYNVPAPAVSPRTAADELQRRRLMVGLSQAQRKNGVDGEAQVANILDQLESMGYATHNPAQGVPQVQFAPTSNSSYESGGGYGQPQYSQPRGRTPLWERDPTFARRLGMGRNGFQIAGAATPIPQGSGMSSPPSISGLLGTLMSFLGR